MIASGLGLGKIFMRPGVANVPPPSWAASPSQSGSVSGWGSPSRKESDKESESAKDDKKEKKEDEIVRIRQVKLMGRNPSVDLQGLAIGLVMARVTNPITFDGMGVATAQTSALGKISVAMLRVALQAYLPGRQSLGETLGQSQMTGAAALTTAQRQMDGLIKQLEAAKKNNDLLTVRFSDYNLSLVMSSTDASTQCNPP